MMRFFRRQPPPPPAYEPWPGLEEAERRAEARKVDVPQVIAKLMRMHADQIERLMKLHGEQMERITAQVVEVLRPPVVEAAPHWNRGELPDAVREAIEARAGKGRSRDNSLGDDLEEFAWGELASDHANAEDVAKRILKGANIADLL